MNEDVIRNEILNGLLQVDSSFFITNFSMSVEKNTRNLKISFTAKNENGVEISGNKEYA